MRKLLKIDFVSDISCPWCALGLQSLSTAMPNLRNSVSIDIQFQPFELNPSMPAEGENAVEHLMRKLGMSKEQIAHNQESLRERGAQLGFIFDMDKREKIYNTFNAHRLLYWANSTDKALALKQAMFVAYFSEGKNIADHVTLKSLANEVGLDADRAQAVLESNEFGNEVRERENFYTSHGIHGVPAVIVNQRHLIEGAQPPEIYVQILQQLAAAPTR